MSDYRSEAAAQYPYLTTSGHDHTAWAKRIMYREQKGDTLLTHYQVQEAKRGLGLTEAKKQ